MSTTNEDLRVQMAKLEGKLDTFMIQQIEDAKDRKEQWLDFNTRLRVIEDVHARVQPIEAKETLNKVATWQNNWNVRMATILAIAVAVGFIGGFVFNLLGSWGIIKG
jgi:hypothetical protein